MQRVKTFDEICKGPFPPTRRWWDLWEAMSAEARHELVRRMGSSYNAIRALSNSARQPSPVRARKLAAELRDMGYRKVTKAWFRPDLW